MGAADGGAGVDGIRHPSGQPERYRSDARGGGHGGRWGGEGNVDAADVGAQGGGGRGLIGAADRAGVITNLDRPRQRSEGNAARAGVRAHLAGEGGEPDVADLVADLDRGGWWHPDVVLDVAYVGGRAGAGQ